MPAQTSGVGTTRSQTPPDGRPSTTGKTKLAINLTDQAAGVVRDIAAQQGVTVSEVMRRAIALEKFVVEQLGRDATFLVKLPDGSIETVHFVL